jgi:hypothetical protein
VEEKIWIIKSQVKVKGAREGRKTDQNQIEQMENGSLKLNYISNYLNIIGLKTVNRKQRLSYVTFKKTQLFAIYKELTWNLYSQMG